MEKLLKVDLNIIGRDLEETKDFLLKGADINFKTYSSENALFFSDYETTQFLLETGIDKYQKNKQGCNALFYAEGQVLQLLIDAGLNPNELNNEEQSPLFYVNDKDSFNTLLRNGADINKLDVHGNNALLNILPIASDKEALVYAMVESGIDINAVNEKGYNALFIGGLQYAKYLIEKGIDVNHLDNDGNNILLFTLKNFKFSKNYDMAKLLINLAHVSIEEPNYEDEIAIMYANEISVLELFIENGIDFKAKNIISNFVVNDNLEMVEYLLNKGVDIQTRNIRGHSLLSLVKSKEMAMLLIDNGIECEEYDLRFCEDDILNYYKEKKC